MRLGTSPSLSVLPFLLVACGEAGDEACDGGAIISGVLLDPLGDPTSQELAFLPVGEEGDDESVSLGAKTDNTVHASSFTVTTNSDGTFSVEVEPGPWEISGVWDGEPPEGDVCEAFREVSAEECGEHEISLAYDCYWID